MKKPSKIKSKVIAGSGVRALGIPTLVQRRYSEWARPASAPELSVAVHHEGLAHYFPLATSDVHEARKRARSIQAIHRSKGWNLLIGSMPREFTVALFWMNSPVACTYATLFTMPPGADCGGVPHPASAVEPMRVGICEPDPNVRKALEFWISRNEGYSCVATEAGWSSEMTDAVSIVMANRNLPETAGDERLAALKVKHEGTAIIPFGVFPESDFIFHSVSGVNRGYFFRRRVPEKLFEPLGASPAERRDLDCGNIEPAVRSYFQGLFAASPSQEPSLDKTHFTQRENEILQCLGKGLKDKEIAGALGLSVWTVHGHVKNLFEKMRVHSRTEAVVKYLQK